ncbi:hypothetical protein [Vibrio metschnikovii]|uniref:Uncharacterized protein n=1 Tax=Vibrio metschnikovii TaxID=28172 RepID=A0A9X0RBQ7_VIBME|nr:hypothetical protein [Vibrio metschnikovii]MBC5853468.1 hypothetical protein [Vibrio metschnikovii]
MLNWIKRTYREHKNKVVFSAALLAGIIAFSENLVAFGSFINTYNPFSEQNSSPPIDIGMPISEVEVLLGQPQEIDFISRSYFSHGIEVNPSYEYQDLVGGITVKKLPSGVMFKGRVDGISLNSSVDDIKNTKGRPTYWGVESDGKAVAIWYAHDLLTIVNFEPDKNNISVATSITHTESASIVAYRSILLSIFQELKAGRVSQFAKEFEARAKSTVLPDGMLTLESFANTYLHQKYQLIAMKPALMGGAELYVGFGDTLLYFWIYPLSWKQPTLRAIVDIEKFHKQLEG